MGTVWGQSPKQDLTSAKDLTITLPDYLHKLYIYIYIYIIINDVYI